MSAAGRRSSKVCARRRTRLAVGVDWRGPRGKDGRKLEIATTANDPDGTYGAWLADLGPSEAIERGILAGFEIDVLEIRDPSPILGLSETTRAAAAGSSSVTTFFAVLRTNCSGRTPGTPPGHGRTPE
ncbi:hypothetical protein ACH4ZU_07495 [Streptomyces sp. NPDC020472]|uniref:hypothetical protein n=1 Tax=Streptomyces sp. NPDC020472 TaxID=3365075 RepID=UPI0037A85DCB